MKIREDPPHKYYDCVRLPAKASRAPANIRRSAKSFSILKNNFKYNSSPGRSIQEGFLFQKVLMRRFYQLYEDRRSARKCFAVLKKGKQGGPNPVFTSNFSLRVFFLGVDPSLS